MADKIFYGVQALQPELKILPGSFTLAGTSDPSVKAGAGFTVVRSGTGKWTVTLTDAYPAILSVQTCFELDSDAASNIVLNISNVGTSSFIIHDYDLEDIGGTPPVDLIGSIVHFVVYARNTYLTK